MLASFIPGFVLSFSLILAIGAQNAFVLRQGLRQAHVFWVCLLCTLCDAIVIFAGVAGFGALAKAVPGFETVVRYCGAGFLIWYGAQNFVSAWRGGETLEAARGQSGTLRATLLTLMALTWLNPHFYLDTLVLLGSMSAQYPRPALFGLGATVASGIYFFAVGYGARLLAPLFAKPRSWQVLDVIIGCTMWGIALKLLIM